MSKPSLVQRLAMMIFAPGTTLHSKGGQTYLVDGGGAYRRTDGASQAKKALKATGLSARQRRRLLRAARRRID